MILSTDSSEKLKIEASRVDPSYNNHLFEMFKPQEDQI
jgi:hypothetical protein